VFRECWGEKNERGSTARGLMVWLREETFDGVLDRTLTAP